MKSLILSLLASLVFVGPQAHAFLSSEEQTELLSSMNQINPGAVQFEEIRCAIRNRMCLVKMELGLQKLKVGCTIERVNSAEDLMTQVYKNGVPHIQLSEYAHNAIAQCIESVTP